jgi:hypothetical protein
MAISRRDAVSRLAALTAALPLARLTRRVAADPLSGTIADYQAGRRRGEWTALEVTTHALDRCRDAGARFRAIDVLDADTALRAARALLPLIGARRLAPPTPADPNQILDDRLTSALPPDAVNALTPAQRQDILDHLLANDPATPQPPALSPSA